MGLSGPWNHTTARRQLGHYATFTPRPNTSYHIQPKFSFQVLLGDFQPHSKLGRTFGDAHEFDFTALELDNVEIIHTERNQLLLLKEGVSNKEDLSLR